jgi:hypothetical protein
VSSFPLHVSRLPPRLRVTCLTDLLIMRLSDLPVFVEATGVYGCGRA